MRSRRTAMPSFREQWQMTSPSTRAKWFYFRGTGGEMSKKVMVVDDSRTVRQRVGLVLSQAGYDVLEASDGIEGAEKINTTKDIAMVICDVNMPRMNGIE